jgi:hypothetical protein
MATARHLIAGNFLLYYTLTSFVRGVINFQGSLGRKKSQ